MLGLAVLFGAIVGFALGLTGGGGGVFAVPLLVYGLSVAPRAAVGISLASVGGTALFGTLPRLTKGEVEIRTGLLFAIAGMVGAPLGAQLAGWIPEQFLLFLFAMLMLLVATRMWRNTQSASSRSKGVQDSVRACEAADGEPDGSRAACQRDSDGKLRLTSACARLLVLVGLGTGVLSGLFGVGGGFVIVPALVLFSGMGIHQAVGTSLLAIVLISFSGVASYLASGQEFSWDIAGLFLLGGVLGMLLGSRLSRKIHGPALQKLFAIAIVVVAAFVILKSFVLL